MKYIVDTDIANKYKLSAEEVFLAMSLKLNPGLQSTIECLQTNGYIKVFDGKYFLSIKGDSAMTDILLDSETTKDQESRLQKIAPKLIELFPKGLKPGTNYMWRGSEISIIKRLKMLEKVYGVKLDLESCIDAAQRYIASFNGDYSFMQLLKYFIIKNDESQLISFIENKEGASKSLFNPETSELVV